jgi:hypothetical protein
MTPHLHVVKLLWQSLEPVVDTVKSTGAHTKAGRFISEASAELLKNAPDLTLAKRKISAAAASMPTPSEALHRAQAAMKDVEAKSKKEKAARKRKTSRKKTTRKKATAKKKTTRKKATAKKKTTRKKAAAKKTTTRKRATAKKKTTR